MLLADWLTVPDSRTCSCFVRRVNLRSRLPCEQRRSTPAAPRPACGPAQPPYARTMRGARLHAAMLLLLVTQGPVPGHCLSRAGVLRALHRLKPTPPATRLPGRLFKRFATVDVGEVGIESTGKAPKASVDDQWEPMRVARSRYESVMGWTTGDAATVEGGLNLSVMEEVLREAFDKEAWSKSNRGAGIRKVAFVVVSPLVGVTAFMLCPVLFNFLDPLLHLESIIEEGVVSSVINGILVPAVGLLLGTLTSLTTGILWTRQKDIRETLNTEFNILDMLATSYCNLLAGDPARRREALAETRDYLYCLVGESSPAFTPLEKERIFDETNRKSLRLLELCVLDIPDSLLWDAKLGGANSSPDRARRIINFIMGLIDQLNTTRAKRRTLVETGFPKAHYGLLIGLELCILTAFLLECTAAGNPVFFSALKSRVILAIVSALFTAIPTLLLDLASPFSGLYQIGSDVMIGSTAQLLLDEEDKARRQLQDMEAQVQSQQTEQNAQEKTPISRRKRQALSFWKEKK